MPRGCQLRMRALGAVGRGVLLLWYVCDYLRRDFVQHAGHQTMRVRPVQDFASERVIRDALSLAVIALRMDAENGPGGGSRTHTGSDPRQILSLLRLPVPPLRENSIENSMSGVWGKGAGRARRRCARASGAAIPPLRGPTRQIAARKKQSGRFGRNDNSGGSQKARDSGPFGSAQGRRDDNSGGSQNARDSGPFGSAQGRREDNSGREGVGKMWRALPAFFVVRAVNPALALRLRSGQACWANLWRASGA